MEDSYIVRIYRRERDRDKKVVGLVETVETDERKAFANVDELWRILEQPVGKKMRNEEESRG